MSDEYGPITLQPFDYEDPRNYAAMPLEAIRIWGENATALAVCPSGSHLMTIKAEQLLSLIKAHDIAVTEKKIARKAHLVTLEEDGSDKALTAFEESARQVLEFADTISERNAEIRTLQARIDHLTADQQTKTWLLSRRGKLIRKLGRKISSLVKRNKS